MTHEERSLLLATSRVLRAQIRGKQHLTKEDMDDVKDLDEVLNKFEAKPGTTNEDSSA